MYCALLGVCFRISLPLEQAAEGKMLHDREFSEDFRSVHLQHALVDLAPAVLDAADIVEHGRVFPERSAFDVVDELDGGEVHVAVLVVGDDALLGHCAWRRCFGKRAFDRRGR